MLRFVPDSCAVSMAPRSTAESWERCSEGRKVPILWLRWGSFWLAEASAFARSALRGLRLESEWLGVGFWSWIVPDLLA